MMGFRIQLIAIGDINVTVTYTVSDDLNAVYAVFFAALC